MFKIRIYDKSDHPTENIFWILAVISLVLIGIWFLFDTGQSWSSSFIFYIAFALMIIIKVIRIIQTAHNYGPIGEASYLTVNDDSIHFLDKKVSISKVNKIIIRLRDKEVQYNHIGNNYLEITTQYGEIYKFAILISDSKDIIQVDRIIGSLKPKIKNVTYENYL